MKIIFQSKNKYVLRFDKGEEVITNLINFCEARNIGTGFFLGIGAAEEVTTSFYDVDKKEYLDAEIKEKLEIVSLLGNVATMEDKIIIHTHGNFSDSKARTRGGHIKKLVVSATCEVILEVLEGEIERKYSPDIGLNLMK